MYKPLVSILGDFYENRFLFIEALYVVNLPSVQGTGDKYFCVEGGFGDEFFTLGFKTLNGSH